jgi:uncharacterized cupin superfamily protein
MAKVTIEKLDQATVEKRGINRWPIWTKEISRFDWSYDQTEECLILEGEFSVETDEGTFHVKAGDFVTFAKGLTCVWNITSPVRKHYRFS